MEDLVRRLARVATRRPERPPAGPVRVGDVGTPEFPELVFVDGDARLGPGTGFGVLIVTGDAIVEDGLVWNGLVLIAGTGRLLWAGRGDIHGALWLAGDRGVVLALGGDGSIRYDSCALDRAYRALPLSPITFRER
jgi:hypothetical protein